MCEQCAAETVTLFEFAPDWVLVRATQHGHTMKPGQLGLVTMNDPSFYLSAEPIPAPRRRNGEIDWGPESGPSPPELEAAWDAFNAASDAIRGDLRCDPATGHDLVAACMRVGYGKRSRREVKGREKTFLLFADWLTDRLGRLLVKDPRPARSASGRGRAWARATQWGRLS